MIRVTLELLPFGDSSNPKHLGTIYIANDASGTHTDGNYNYRLTRRGSLTTVFRTGEIKNFPRKRLGAYDLLFRVLRDAIGERNK